MTNDYKETIFWAQQGSCTYKFTVAATAHVKPAYASPSQTKSQHGDGRWVHHPAPSTGVIGNREPLERGPLISQSCSSGGPTSTKTWVGKRKDGE